MPRNIVHSKAQKAQTTCPSLISEFFNGRQAAPKYTFADVYFLFVKKFKYSYFNNLFIFLFQDADIDLEKLAENTNYHTTGN
jgi:hypothetical protein